MSRVQDNSKSDLSVEKKLIDGYYHCVNLERFRTKDLERILSKIIQLECKKHDGVENTQRPEWWPTGVIFFNTLELIKQEAHNCSHSWRSMLRNVVGTCLAFTRKSPLYYDETCSKFAKRSMNLNMSPKFINKKRLRPRNQEGIQESESEKNIINNKKRRLMENAPLSNIVNLNDNIDNNYEEKKMLESDRSQVVNQKDIFMPETTKPLDKDGFMTSLQLLPKNSTPTTSHLLGEDIETKKYDCSIPFSSDIGRILMKRDRYILSKEFYMRKTEKMEYYLSDKTLHLPKCGSYDVSYNKRDECNHVYRFPKRQLRQGRNYLEHIKKELCRPVNVSLERVEIKSYQIKKLQLCRNFSIVIKRISDY